MNERLQSVRRRRASSGRCSYDDPLVVHETSRTKVELITFSYERSTGRAARFSLRYYDKKFGSWIENRNKRVSFSESMARTIIDAVQARLQIAESLEEGEFVVLRPGQSQGANLKAVAALLDDPEAARLIRDPSVQMALAPMLQDALRIRSLREAVSELRSKLDGGIVDEREYQVWCEAHSWAFGSMYFVNDAFRNISISDQVDLLLPLISAGYRDIVELKRPDMRVIEYDSAHRNFYFSKDAAMSVGQVSRYIDVLHAEAGERGLRDHPDIIANHPHELIIIGRSNDWSDEKLRALHSLNRRLNGISIMTFDQLLQQGEQMLNILAARTEQSRSN